MTFLRIACILLSMQNGRKKPEEKHSGFFDRIYKAVKTIPKGYVASYGTIAALAGKPHAARVVGWALHVNPDPENIPCYRIVTKNGEVSRAFAFGGENMQRKMLAADGIAFDDFGRVKKEFFMHNDFL